MPQEIEKPSFKIALPSQQGSQEKERDGNGWSMEQSEHTKCLIVCMFLTHGFWCSRIITIITQRSLITDHHDKYNDENVLNILRIIQMWHRDPKLANAVGKMPHHW